MTYDDQPQFYRALHELAAVFRVKLNDEQTAGYWRALEGHGLGPVRSAMEECAKSEERFPVPAAIRKRMYQDGRRLETVRALPPPPHAETPHAKAGFALINRILVEKLGPAERRAAFVKMAAQFPGVGWEEAIEETDRLMDSQGA